MEHAQETYRCCWTEGLIVGVPKRGLNESQCLRGEELHREKKA